MLGVHHHQRVAVGRGLQHLLRREDPASAGPVLHDHRLTENPGELLGVHPAENVGRGARRLRRIDLNGFARKPVLRGRRQRREE